MLWLLLAVTVVFLCVSCFSYPRLGWLGVLAAGVSGLVCWLAASAALFATTFTAGSPHALSGTFLSIMLRTAVPFLVSLILIQTSKPLADAGLFGMMVLNYLVVLAVETFLAVRVIQAGQSASTVV